MALQSAKDNVIDTLKDKLDSLYFSESDIENIAESIVKNLCIEHQQFPKWD